MDTTVFNPDLLSKELLHENPLLLDKIATALACNRREAAHALREVLRFLFLVAGNRSSTLTPSHRVDLAWHELILFTKVYQSFCQRWFGRFVHHSPGGSRDENAGQYAKTLGCYEVDFGTADPAWWPPGTTSACGPCEAIGPES